MTPAGLGSVSIVDEVIQSLKKWAFLSAAAIGLMAAGCGGSGHSSSASVSTKRPAAATINLPGSESGNPYGTIYVAFLTGQGRAPGDLYMNMERVDLFDSTDNITASRLSSLQAIQLHLAAYTLQYATLDANLANFPNGEHFDIYSLNPYSFAIEQSNGTVGLNFQDPGYLAVDTTTLPQALPIALTAFPGRDVVLPVFVDDSMFFQNVVNGNQVASLNLSQFQAVNEPATSDPYTSGKLVGLVSDFVRFDLTHLPQNATSVPTLVVDGQPATHFYFSGDNYAISDDTPTSPQSNFEELTLDPNNPMDGYMAPPNSAAAQQLGLNGFPGTYDVQQADPTDLTGQSKIFALFGRWRDVSSVVNLNSTTFDIIIFPNTRNTYSESYPADAIGIVHNGTTITNLYGGFGYFTPNTPNSPSDLPKVKLFPLGNFVTGSTAGEIDYTLSSLTNANGAGTTDEPSVRNGTYTYSSGTLPTGFLSTGTFVVFR